MQTDKVHTFSTYLKAIGRLVTAMVVLLAVVEWLGAAFSIVFQYLFRQTHRQTHLKTN